MLFKIKSILLAVLLVIGLSFTAVSSANASTLQPTPSPNSAEETDGASGPWWPEVNAYVGCNDWWSYSGAAWDLVPGAWYTTAWDYNYDTPSGSGGAWDQNRQNIQASSSGFLTTSTFYGTATNYYHFRATVRLYKDGNQVGYHTTECYR